MKTLATALAFLIALTGLLLAIGSEILTAVALENALLHFSGLQKTYTWQVELVTHWKKWLSAYAHPLIIIAYFGPVLAVFAMANAPRAQWLMVAIVAAAFALDLFVFLDTMQSPNSDRKGCEICYISLLLHAMFGYLAVLLGLGWLAARYGTKE